MSFAIAALMIFSLAAIVAYPLVFRTGDAAHDGPRSDRETLERAKHVALMAIREAELDRSMGKLSEEDYASLRGIYEQRAVDALVALDAADATAASVSASDTSGASTAPAQTGARFCAGCGRAFASDERFCPACGRPRSR